MADFLFDQGKNKIEGSPKTIIDSIGLEIANVREGADGKLYDTAGDAVRGQFDELQNQINQYKETIITGTNKLDPTKLVHWKMVDASGNIIDNPDAETSVSDKIYIPEGENKVVNIYRNTHGVDAILNSASFKLSFYNNNGEFIETLPSLGEAITIPSNSKYIILTIPAIYSSRLQYIMVAFDDELIPYEPFTLSLNPNLVQYLQDDIDNSQSEIENIKSRVNNIVSALSFPASTKFVDSALAKIKILNSGVVNIGFFGDSWTQGTQDSIIEGKYETYVKWLSKLLWDKYGFAGLGWLDFARDGGTGKIFGCSDLYEHWSYTFSGTITGLDGSTPADAPNCLGICCAHTIFANAASLSLTFDAGYIDKFKIRYYKNAHFTVSVNGGSPIEITANANDNWQETELGTTGIDTTSIVITSLLDDTIIFGIDCFYGTKGVRCHKIGNRSLSLAKYLLMDSTQFETGIAYLNLSWASVLFAINDLGSSTSDAACEAIVNNHESFISRVKTAFTNNGLCTCDLSLIGCANISNNSYTGLPKLERYLYNFAVLNKYGWASTRECIGVDKAELVFTELFSDTIHLNKIGSEMLGDYIFHCLFEYNGQTNL